MALPTVTLFFTSVMLNFPAIYLASNVVYSFQCIKIPCSSSTFCPPWHYCDLHKRSCEPCTRCVDGSDVARAPANCQDPSFCIDSLYAKQDYDSACPKLRIAEGYSCWGECNPCGGTFGSYLGTTCRTKCQDDEWEVLSCVFLNDVAQWNVSRKPYWIIYETLSLPPTPSTPPPTSPPPPVPQPPSTPPPGYHLEAIAGIVVGTVLGVAVIFFFAIMLVVRVGFWKKKFPKSSDETLTKAPGRAAVEDSDASEPEQMPIISIRQPVEIRSSKYSQSSLRLHRQPIENSDAESYAHQQSSSPSGRVQSLLKLHQSSWPSASLSLLSLHSDRPTRQLQEHSPLLVNAPPIGCSDSGHPPCRCSSSSSLQHETLRKSVMDLGRGLPREATEHCQETSSGFHPRESLPELHYSFYI